MSNRPPKFRRRYMNAIISHLMDLKQLERDAASRLLLKHYRTLYRQWGHELNIEEFAEKVLCLEEIVQRHLTKKVED